MKITWEEQDIIAGRYIHKPTDSGKINATRAYKIGFLPHALCQDEEARYCLISICDGMVTLPKNKTDLAKSLTESEALPLATDHLVDLIKSMYRQNEGIVGIAGK